MRPLIHIQHQVPEHHRLAPIIDGTDTQFLHIPQKGLFHIPTGIPFSYRSLRENQFLIRPCLMYGQQLLTITTIIMISASRKIPCSLLILKNPQRILTLILHIVIIIIVVERIYLNSRILLRQKRSQCALHEITLLFPAHKERRRISPVQRLILRRNTIYFDAFFLERLNPLQEIKRIIVIIIRIQLPSSPGIIRFPVLQTLHLHPFRACPRRPHNLQVWINRQDLF